MMVVVMMGKEDDQKKKKTPIRQGCKPILGMESSASKTAVLTDQDNSGYRPSV